MYPYPNLIHSRLNYSIVWAYCKATLASDLTKALYPLEFAPILEEMSRVERSNACKNPMPVLEPEFWRCINSQCAGRS
jgi:hypothetical protein